MAQVDYLYQPPYEQQGRTSAMDRMTNDFGQFGMVDPARRESFPVSFSLIIIVFDSFTSYAYSLSRVFRRHQAIRHRQSQVHIRMEIRMLVLLFKDSYRQRDHRHHTHTEEQKLKVLVGLPRPRHTIDTQCPVLGRLSWTKRSIKRHIKRRRLQFRAHLLL
jgi:hypothetical protein